MESRNRTRRSLRRDRFLDPALADKLLVLTQKPAWRTCRSSTLVGLKYTEVRLKQYAAQVRQALGRSVSEQKQIRFTVKFEKDENLKLEETHPDGILITVHTQDMTIEGSQEQLGYEGVFMTWGSTEISGNTTHLPFYFDRGPLHNTKVVRETLTKLFDCSIYEFKFSQNQLCLFCLSISEVLGSSKGLKFHYQLKNVRRRSRVIIASDEDFCLKLWNRNVGNRRSHKQRLSTVTHQMLLNQLFSHISVDLALFDLVEVSCREASFKENGQIRIRNEDVAKRFLDLLSKYTP